MKVWARLKKQKVGIWEFVLMSHKFNLSLYYFPLSYYGSLLVHGNCYTLYWKTVIVLQNNWNATLLSANRAR